MSKLLRQNVGGTDYSMVGCALTATCATPAATAAKVATLTDGDALADGMSVVVQFTEGNTAASPLTLTVGGVTANICDSRGQNIGGNIWQAGNIVTFLYTFGKFLLLNCNVAQSLEVILPAYESTIEGGGQNKLGQYIIPEDGVYAIDWSCACVNNTQGGTSIGVKIAKETGGVSTDLTYHTFFMSAIAWSNIVNCNATRKLKKDDVISFYFMCANPAECNSSNPVVTRVI